MAHCPRRSQHGTSLSQATKARPRVGASRANDQRMTREPTRSQCVPIGEPTRFNARRINSISSLAYALAASMRLLARERVQLSFHQRH